MRLLVSATEPSADLLAAEALGHLGQLDAYGLGGPKLRDAGVRLLRPPRPHAMGLVEVLRHLGEIRRDRAALLSAEPPDVFLAVDAPDFHLPLARRMRGFARVGYVSPQLWAWRRGRVRAVAAAYDRLLCLFPFEPALYAGTGLDARFVGHPVVDRVSRSRREPGTLAIFPGSRPQEIARHLDTFVAAARLLHPRRIVLAGDGPAPPGVEVVSAAEALSLADRAIAKSGTVTLELSLAGIPFAVAHRVHPLTYALGRLLVRGVKHLALPNILLGREVVREFVQDFDAASLAAAVAAAEEPPADELRYLLGGPGASGRAADAIESARR